MKADIVRIGGGLKAAFAALVLLAALGVSGWGQSVAASGGVPSELAAELQRLSWDEQEIRVLGQEPVDWGAFRARHARLVAEALEYARSEDAEMGPLAQARIAVEACSMFQEMQSLGYGETAAARAVFAAVRASLRETVAWRAEGGQGDLQQRIRSRFRQQLRIESAGQLRTQTRERIQAEARSDGGAPVLGPGPIDPPGKS